MYIAAYVLLLIAFLCSLGGAAWIVLPLGQGRSEEETEHTVRVAEWANVVQFCAVLIASGMLLRALIAYDFSLVYVASYTDRVLPLFYRMTAFWAGQAGSLLFWTLSVVLLGLIFQFTPAYARLSAPTKLWFWLFYLLVTAFFSLLLTAWINPFLVYDSAPADGSGLNPLLQNPGMIFHPPLLFLGYAGFTIPGCLALAQALSRKPDGETDWARVARPFTVSAWVFLTAGIVLGGWWSYMELGWGGYWAWDPVENASLIPWLVATAALHTQILQTRRDKLHRVNILLMALTTVSAFFATYLTRSGVVESLHAFGDTGVGLPLLVFVLTATALGAWCALLGKRSGAVPLAGPETREGFLVITAWLLLALAAIILIATLWPVITAVFSARSVGLDQHFYNRVCLPLFALLASLFAICPWLGWSGGVRNVRGMGVTVGVFFAIGGALWTMGYTHPVALIAMAASIAAIVSVLLLWSDRAVRAHRPSLAACGVHLGVALMTLGIAFSGPYKVEREVVLEIGGQTVVGPFTVTLERLTEGTSSAYRSLSAELTVTRQGNTVGIALPERRIYAKRSRQAFAEAAVIPDLGNEFYASLLAVDAQGRATLRLSANPLINWVWIGGILVCVFPFLGLTRRRNEEKRSTGNVAAA